MSLGKGFVASFSRKQKIQGKSFTKDELVGSDDTLPQALWTKYFIEDQGYLMDRNLINQYNKSAILMDTNGHLLVSKRTNHIKTRYYFVKDNVDQGGVDIQYFPAVAPFPKDSMWSDILTNPKMGREFLEYRSMLMNSPLGYIYEKKHEDIDKVSGS